MRTEGEAARIASRRLSAFSTSTQCCTASGDFDPFEDVVVLEVVAVPRGHDAQPGGRSARSRHNTALNRPVAARGY
jgi:hypothetical protein